MNKKDITIYLFLCFCFASTLTAGKLALINGVFPFLLAGVRFFLGSILLVLSITVFKISWGAGMLKRLKQFLVPQNNEFYKIVLLSVFMFIIPFSCIINALVFLPSGIAGIVGSSIPLFTMIFSHFMFKDEKFTFYKLSGLLLGAAGLTVLALAQGKSFSAEDSSEFFKGFTLYLTGCISIGLGNALAKKFSLKTRFIVSSFYQAVLAGTLFLLISIIFYDFSILKLNAKAYTGMIYVAIFGMGIPYVLYYSMLSRVGPTKMSTIPLIIPVLAVFFGYIILNERVTVYTILSLLLVLLGVGLILFFKKRVKMQKPVS